MLDRSTFVRPIAHRGLHGAAAGRIENTAPAFAAAIEKRYGIECDLRPAAGGLPLVFHDARLERLVDGEGQVCALSPAEVRRLRYRGSSERILTFAELLDLVAGRVPLLVEIKSEWKAPDAAFMRQIGRLAASYQGPVALMSFDPAVMSFMKDLAPDVPRGMVSGIYRREEGWWHEHLDDDRAYRLSHLLESGPVEPVFFAYHVADLPTPVTRFVREVLGLPLFAWTVRSPQERQLCAQWADAPIFEGWEP